MSATQENEKKGVFKRFWATLRSPSRFSLGGLLVVGFAAGIIFWGGFHTVVEYTNTERFCISCHEMGEFVYPEYQMTGHYENRTGVRAKCADCHVPDAWGPKMVRKVVATRELWHKALGTISTKEKFEDKRLELAQRVWRSMERSDSKECRNCHDFEYMDYFEQSNRAMQRHMEGFDEGKTCIECHKGIAHDLPAGYDAEQ